jgi:MFS transporter, OFA family, oxalate/formate antiporter
MHVQPDTPFSPTRVPFFYGWVILGLGAIGVLMSAPGQTVGVSAFTDFLIRDLGITRTTLSLSYLIGTLSSSLILSRAGHAYDVHGARIMGTVVAVALGTVLLLLSVIPAIVAGVGRVVPSIPVAPLTFVVMTLGFFALRFFGQGVLALVARNMVLKWFELRRGLANALVGVATTVGFSASPVLFDGMIGSYGWQGAWQIIGVVVAIPFALFFLLLARDNPQECGLEADNGVVPVRKRVAPEVHPSAQFTLPEARRTLTFWVFLGIITLASMYFTGLTFNIVSVFAEAGMDRARAVSIFLPSSIIALVLNLLAGWVSDHIRLKYLVILQGIGIVLSTLAMLTLSAPGAVALLIIGNGINSGMFGIVMNVPWPRFFGTVHLGRISGFAAGWGVAGSALGPYLFSLSLDVFGGYGAASIITLVVSVALVAAAPFANRPEAPQRVPESQG